MSQPFNRLLWCFARVLAGIGLVCAANQQAQAVLVSFDFVGVVTSVSQPHLFHCADTPNYACPSPGRLMYVGERFGGSYSFETDTVGIVQSYGLVDYKPSGAESLLTVGINGGQSFSYDILIRGHSSSYPDSYELRAGSPLYEFGFDLWGHNILEDSTLPSTPPNIADAYRNGGYLSYHVNPSYLDEISFTLVSLTTTPAPIPEPESYGMLLAGLGLLGFMARRRKQKAA